MAYGIFVRFVGSWSDKPIEQWIRSYDLDAENGRGRVTFTPNASEALAFADAKAALTVWKQPSTVQPLRSDGKPNRPLSAYTCEIKELK